MIITGLDMIEIAQKDPIALSVFLEDLVEDYLFDVNEHLHEEWGTEYKQYNLQKLEIMLDDMISKLEEIECYEQCQTLLNIKNTKLNVFRS